jgi:hypothetical protein
LRPSGPSSNRRTSSLVYTSGGNVELDRELAADGSGVEIRGRIEKSIASCMANP